MGRECNDGLKKHSVDYLSSSTIPYYLRYRPYKQIQGLGHRSAVPLVLSNSIYPSTLSLCECLNSQKKRSIYLPEKDLGTFQDILVKS
jgi:hypothetical protein